MYENIIDKVEQLITMYKKGERNSYTLWESALKTYNDEETRSN